MNRLLLTILLLGAHIASAAPAVRVDFELYEMPLPRAITLIYTEVFKRPFMLAPELAGDERKLTFKLTPNTEAGAFINRYFSNMNVKIHERDGVDYIAPFTPKVPMLNFVYRPRHRSVEYLSGLLGNQFTGTLQQQSSETDKQAVVTAQATINNTGDSLVYFGTAENVAKIKSLLPKIDVPAGQVLVTGYVFEVQNTEKNGSGLALVAKLLSGKVDISIGSTQSLDNVISLGTGSLSALYELFQTDSRFHVISSPQLRVRSGSDASFSVGADVPVLGAISYQDGRPVQSVEYRSSGVLLGVSPQIRGNAIDLRIQQQLSNFIKTDTGVNGSPTLTKRDIVTDVTLTDNEIIVLGGLAETKNSAAKTRLSFLPFYNSKSSENSRSDIIIVLQVKKL